MPIRTAIDDYLDRRRAAGLARGSLALYRRHLTEFANWLATEHQVTDLAGVRRRMLRDYLSHLETRPPGGSGARRASLTPASRASMHRSLRTFWRFAAAEGWLTSDQAGAFDRLPAPRVVRTPRSAADKAAIRQLTTSDQAAPPDETTARDRAIVLLLAESGMRISELCGLTDGAVDLKRRRAWVVGKGEKRRPVYWRAGAAAALARYLLLRRGERGGQRPLMRGTSWRNNGGAMTPDAVRSQMKRLAKHAGVTLPNGAPLHWFRHGFARDALAHGADIAEVSQFLGHADIATTMIYLTEDAEQLGDAYERIFTRGEDRHGRKRQAGDAAAGSDG
jgi:integrase/recombinase XerD